MDKIKIAILGYGNLGKGVELAVNQNPDMDLVCIFTRRSPESVKTLHAPVYHINNAGKMADKIDVLLLCGGSATDLPIQGPEFAKLFNTVDSFDTHAKIPEYFDNVNKSATETNHVATICVGWDPGLFSIQRTLLESVLPNGNSYYFYGRGLSQGHSDAVRRVPGVKRAVQYTVPYDEAVEKVRNGENPKFTSVREKMWRECFVVAEEGADKILIEKTIKEMPNYFDEYNTIVHFITEDEFLKNHSSMPHGGFVLRSGFTGIDNSTKQIAEFSLKLESNPEFTASVLIAYARATYRLAKKQDFGCKTVFDIAPSLLSLKTNEDLRKEFL